MCRTLPVYTIWSPTGLYISLHPPTRASASISKYTEFTTCCVLEHRGSFTVNLFRFGDGDAGASFATGHGECFPRIPFDIVTLGNASSISACTEDISADGRSLSLHPLFALTLPFSRRGRLPRDTLLSIDFTILADTLRSSPRGPWRPPAESLSTDALGTYPGTPGDFRYG